MIFSKPRSRRYTRLAQLKSLLAHPEEIVEVSPPQTEEEWLIQIQQWHQEGLYANEPDFPWLLARYEGALMKSQESRDPTFYPPCHFEPQLEEPDRLSRWRVQWRFPELHRVHRAILSMTIRALEGKPPITRDEWNHFAEWYVSARPGLPCQSGAIKLPTGVSLSRSSIDYELRVNDGLIIDYAVTVLNNMRTLHHHFAQELS